MGVKVIVASTDNEDDARDMASEKRFTFPIAYGVQAELIEKLGAFQGVRQEKTYVHPTEFILNPDGNVMASMYSSTPLGRIEPERGVAVPQEPGWQLTPAELAVEI